MDETRAAALRSLPSVSALLSDGAILAASHGLLPEIVTAVVRRQVADARQAVLDGNIAAGPGVIERSVVELSLLREPQSVVINGTGVIIQTNLGRAPVSQAAAAAMAQAASSYLPLEVERETNERGGRGREIELLMRALTGAERTLVVNNNAAAVLLTLAATCAGRDVIVSRGEAVEIGGGFRVPDVLRQSGAVLVEVGTTNRTYAADYSSSVSDRTAAFLRVHASNFAITGFTTRPELDELAACARQRGVLLIEDVGSGCLLDTAPYGLAHEPTLGEGIAAGVDVVCASGDKLLGGPQAGLVLGRADLVGRIARHPLARALRADKTCLAGVAATLRHYARGEAVSQVPVWWSISRSEGWLRDRVEWWRQQIGAAAGLITTESVVGGGSMPGRTLPSCALTVTVAGRTTDELARRLRLGSPSIFPRIVDGHVAIDARTVLPDQDDALVSAVRATLAN